MCGRYIRTADKQRIAEAFRLSALPATFVLPPDYNVAPMTFQPVIRLNRHTGEREVVMMWWGLIPHFAKSVSEFKGFSTIKAKAETVLEKALWRSTFQKRRCLVPQTASMNGRRSIPKRRSRSSTR